MKRSESCDGARKGERYWRAGVSPREEIVIEAWRRGRAPGAFPFLWIEFTGWLSPPGEWGHLGRYERQVSTFELNAARIVTGADMKRCGLD